MLANGFLDHELGVLRRLTSPENIQRFLDEDIGYNKEKGGATCAIAWRIAWKARCSASRRCACKDGSRCCSTWRRCATTTTCWPSSSSAATGGPSPSPTTPA